MVHDDFYSKITFNQLGVVTSVLKLGFYLLLKSKYLNNKNYPRIDIKWKSAGK